MNSLELVYRLTLDDWRAYQKECMRRMRRSGAQRRMVTVLCVLPIAVLAAGAALNATGLPIEITSLAIGMLIAMCLLWLYLRSWSRAVAPRSGGLFFQECRYVLDPQGMRTTRPGIETSTNWSTVHSVSQTANHLYLWVDRTQAHVIPWRALPPAVSRADLLAALTSWRGVGNDEDNAPDAAGGNSDGEHACPSAGQGSPESPGASWLSALPRLLTLQRVHGMQAAPVWLVWLLGVSALIGWSLLDRLRTGDGAIFVGYGLTGMAWYALIGLAVAAVLCRYSRPTVSMRSALVVLLLLAFGVSGLAALVDVLSPPKLVVMLGSLAAGIYCIAVVMRLHQSASGHGQPAAVAGATFVLLIGWFVTECLHVDTGLWYAPEEDSYDGYARYWDRGESLLFEQPARIEAVISGLAPSTEAAPDAFFVGFAGYGEQRVFAEEIRLAARTVGERYGSTGRELLLLNDRRDLETWPLATVASLRHALKVLAPKMNVDDDILFLSLSSHGSEDYLSVSNGPLMLQNLSDEALAEALREAGIRWRVIVISACHAGSFIDALQDPNTIVIAAAAADRKSFGCSDDRDLTYFGQAFYRDALPGAASLREAFKQTAEAIAARERREGLDASGPTAYFGEAIEEKLAGLATASHAAGR